MAGDLVNSENRNKIRLGIYFIENAKIRYGRESVLLKMLNKKQVRLWFYFIEKGQNKVRLVIYVIENTKIRYGGEVFLLKRLNKDIGWN